MGLNEFENRLKEAIRGVEENVRSVMSMVSLNGNTRTCPKCGNGAVTLQYHAGQDECRGLLGARRATAYGEHLHCRCNVCEYDWAEPVLGMRAEKTGDKKDGNQD